MKFISFSLCIGFLMSIASHVNSQEVIFLHHSTGGGVYNEGQVADWISDYNSGNGTNYQISEMSYPTDPYPWANYPYDYWNLWINNTCDNSEPNIGCLDDFCARYDVIIFKHCFPGADIVAENEYPQANSSQKTLANYKLQYQALRGLMDGYPDNKFIVWTLAPLHRLSTNAENAARANEFVEWVKNEWLTEDGNSHPNIYIFDFFGNTAELNTSPENGEAYCLKYEFEKSHTGSDSHPNTLANQTTGPLFAQFVVNTIEDQEIPTLIKDNDPKSALMTVSFTNLRINLKKEPLNTKLSIYSIMGSLLYDRKLTGAVTDIDLSSLAAGTYFMVLSDHHETLRTKIIIP